MATFTQPLVLLIPRRTRRRPDVTGVQRVWFFSTVAGSRTIWVARRGSFPPVLAGFVLRGGRRGDHGFVLCHDVFRTPEALVIGRAIMYFSLLASGAVGQVYWADT